MSATIIRNTHGSFVVDTAVNLGLDTRDGRWVCGCDQHAACVNVDTQRQAQRAATTPTDWCDGCRDATPAVLEDAGLVVTSHAFDPHSSRPWTCRHCAMNRGHHVVAADMTPSATPPRTTRPTPIRYASTIGGTVDLLDIERRAHAAENAAECAAAKIREVLRLADLAENVIEALETALADIGETAHTTRGLVRMARNAR